MILNKQDLGVRIVKNYKEATGATIKVLEKVGLCFEDIKETGETLKSKFVPALEGMKEAKQKIDSTNDYAHETYEKVGMFIKNKNMVGN